MNVNAATVRRCFFKGDQILQHVLKLRNQSPTHQGQRSQGIRIATVQRQVSCSGPLMATRLWHQAQDNLQLAVSQKELTICFCDHLRAHLHIFETLLKSKVVCQTMRKFWASEVKAIGRRLEGAQNTSTHAQSQVARQLEKSMNIKKFAITKLHNVDLEMQRWCFFVFVF